MTDETQEPTVYRYQGTRARRATEAELERAVRLAEESGELEGLKGKPLDLSDGTDEWFARKMLKDRGFTHPFLEQARDLQTSRAETERIVERLRQRREWLTREDRSITLEEAESFNRLRRDGIARYRGALEKLNSAVLTHNLGTPDWLHRPIINVERAVAKVEDDVGILLPTARVVDSPFTSFLLRVWRAVRRGL